MNHFFFQNVAIHRSSSYRGSRARVQKGSRSLSPARKLSEQNAPTGWRLAASSFSCRNDMLWSVYHIPGALRPTSLKRHHHNDQHLSGCTFIMHEVLCIASILYALLAKTPSNSQGQLRKYLSNHCGVTKAHLEPSHWSWWGSRSFTLC